MTDTTQTRYDARYGVAVYRVECLVGAETVLGV